MDRINEALKDLVARKGGNYTVVAKELGMNHQTLGRYLKGRKPPVDVLAKIKQVYGEDLLNPHQSVQEEKIDFGRITTVFEKAVDAFAKALESNNRQFDRLDDDKKWLKDHIKDLTMSFNSLKQAQ